MAKNRILRAKTANDIDQRIERVLKGLGNPEPPLDLMQVRELLKLDLDFYTADDPGLLQETASRIKVAGKQILKRPSLLIDAVKKFDLRALYIPDQKRILLDQSEPVLKHRWNEAHEVGHSVLPWHEDAMLGDDKYSLRPGCHEQLEAEANFAAGRLLFLRDRFVDEAEDYHPSIHSVKKLKPIYENTYTTTFWRCIEVWGKQTPMVGLITGHPHPSKRHKEFDPSDPCEHFIQSSAFAEHFASRSEIEVFELIAEYCSPAKGGPLGGAEVILVDDNNDEHVFEFETFHFYHSVLTLGKYVKPHSAIIMPSW